VVVRCGALTGNGDVLDEASIEGASGGLVLLLLELVELLVVLGILGVEDALHPHELVARLDQVLLVLERLLLFLLERLPLFLVTAEVFLLLERALLLLPLLLELTLRGKQGARGRKGGTTHQQPGRYHWYGSRDSTGSDGR
jgi:hypothetical protein